MYLFLSSLPNHLATILKSGGDVESSADPIDLRVDYYILNL